MLSRVFTPHKYQSYCINRIVDMPVFPGPGLGAYLGMGLGKTVITLTAVNELKYSRFAVRKVLVIAPKKVAEATWSKEAAKWEHLRLLRIIPVLGSLKQRIRALNTPADVYVINRENVQWLVDYYRNDWPFDFVVIDESSSFKNHQAKRFKSLCWVRKKISRLVELTGTPAPNGLIDLWAQVYLLDGGERLGKTIGGFRQRYFDPDQRNAQQVFSYKPKDGADDTIQGKISDICINPNVFLLTCRWYWIPKRRQPIRSWKRTCCWKSTKKRSQPLQQQHWERSFYSLATALYTEKTGRW